MAEEKNLIRIFITDDNKVGVKCDIESDEETQMAVTGLLSLLDNVPELLDDLVDIYEKKTVIRHLLLSVNSKINS